MLEHLTYIFKALIISSFFSSRKILAYVQTVTQLEQLRDIYPGQKQKYIKSNIDGIVVYKDRKNIRLPEAPEGIEYRTLGTMEKNVDIFAKRMKGAKSWSEKGAANLAKIIALKIGKGFKDKIAALVSGRLSERVTERFEEVIKTTKSSVNKAVKKSVYPMHRGEIPFTNSKVTNGRKAIRSMFDLKPFSEMLYT